MIKVSTYDFKSTQLPIKRVAALVLSFSMGVNSKRKADRRLMGAAAEAFIGVSCRKNRRGASGSGTALAWHKHSASGAGGVQIGTAIRCRDSAEARNAVESST